MNKSTAGHLQAPTDGIDTSESIHHQKRRTETAAPRLLLETPSCIFSVGEEQILLGNKEPASVL